MFMFHNFASVGFETFNQPLICMIVILQTMERDWSKFYLNLKGKNVLIKWYSQLWSVFFIIIIHNISAYVNVLML